MSPYKYSALPSENSSVIRVLVLHSGSEVEELSGSLKLLDLENEENQDYEALSYYWGPPVFSHRINIDGQDLAITESLFAALERLRLADRDRVIWADAICIDQMSTIEKNHQVRLMSKIYTKCARCIAYLGTQADKSEDLIDFMKKLNEWLGRYCKLGGLSTSGNPILHTALEMHGLPPEKDHSWQALRKFYQRPWFRRLWVLQEFVLPKDVTMICGHWEASGIWISTFTSMIFNAVPLIPVLSGGTMPEGNRLRAAYRTLTAHLRVRRALGKSCGQLDTLLLSPPDGTNHSSLVSLLDATQNLEVTDPRDRFFGLLGLATDTDDDSSLLPDYGKSYEDVKDLYMAFLIRQGNGWLLLKQKDVGVSQPSWYPSWARDPWQELRASIKSASLLQKDRYRDHSRARLAISQESERIIAVRGYPIDYISRLTFSVHAPGGAQFYKEVFSFPKSHAQLVHDEEYKRVALRVLTHNDMDQDGTPCTDKFLDQCEKIVDKTCSINGSIADQVAWNGELSDAVFALHASLFARFGVTQSGSYGMFPPEAKAGDPIFMVDGDVDTHVICKSSEDNLYTWVGRAFIYQLDDQIHKIVGNKPPTKILVE